MSTTNRNDLDGNLARAVEQIRAAPVPQESMHQSLDRADRLGTAGPAFRSWKRAAFPVVMGVAATFLFVVLPFMGGPRDSEEQVAKSLRWLAIHQAVDGKGSSIVEEGLVRDSRANEPRDPRYSERRHDSPTFGEGQAGQPANRLFSPIELPGTRRNQSIFDDDAETSVPGQGRPGVVGGSGGGVDEGLTMALPSGTRALSIRASMATAIGGSILPGARVDLLTVLPNSNGKGKSSQVFMQNVEVLAVRGGSFTLRVTPQQAERLARVSSEGAVQLVLRKPDGKEKDAKKKSPQVWRRDAKRPTFARVYVGNGNSLELVSQQVTVTIEGPRARTLVDHIFRNPHGQQLEGTFEYPLPTGASPSYFAMFLGQTRDTVPPRFAGLGEVPALPADKLAQLPPEQIVKHVSTADWGRLREARVVGKEKALQTYEDIVRGRIDPALLEYAGGNTFRGRVFPIPAKGYNRVLIAYEELLPVSQGQAMYRFPLPNCKLAELNFTLNARTDECQNIAFVPADAKKEEGGSQLAYTKTWTEKGPGGEVLFRFTPPRQALQTISGRHGDSGPLYTYARIRPEIKAEAAKPFAKHAVFLLDTSLSEHPDRFAVNLKLLQKILESDSAIEKFNVLAFNVAAAWLDPKQWLDNTKGCREAVLRRLDGIVLEGATDLSAALGKLAHTGLPSGTPLEIFLLSDGQITWGELDVASLVAKFEANCNCRTRFHCYRTGLGADNAELFEALTRRGGGVFNCFTQADLPAAAGAHRQQCVQIDRVRFAGGPQASDVLVAGRKAAVYPDGELIVVGRFAEPGQTNLIVEGTYLGQKFVEEYPVEVRPAGELAARGWAEVAVASLLALNDPKLDSLVTAYCQQFGIGSRVASFLVLENEADYKRLNLEAERGKTVPGGDVGRFLDTAWQGLGKVTSGREAFNRFLDRIGSRVGLFNGSNGEQVKKLIALLKDADFELPEATLTGVLLGKTAVPPSYLAARDANRRSVDPYLIEARRRAAKGDTDGAVRVLSSIIEEHPARGDALRLVGYRLLDLNQPVHAARLFDRVRRQRPFEPHSYLDLARALQESGRYGLAAVHYEIALAGTWHARFHQSLKNVAREDYTRMMRQAAADKKTSRGLADHFGNRLEKMDSKEFQSDLRVSMTWNTDATDIDLWVIEPDGTKCFYQAPRTKNGGVLSRDMTQGYGPERFVAKKAMPGEYTIIVHYFRAHPNLLGGETHVNVTVARNAGSPEETVQRRTVILKRANEQVEVYRVKFE